MKIKKNDHVLITSGKDRGKRGKVIDVFPENERVVVENANLAKKHRRPRRQGEKGQLVEIPKSLHISNVKLICPKCAQASRIGLKSIESGKTRFCKKCGQEI
ncbi:MAG: 50S ribosomal protein L24 [Parcubacteria group bacterium GW2011_GWB1_42_6]|nr:MAG: 50S ribosomal protein L24 [Parcubacteria group bacterium GW2011_GWB1_42_6]